MKSPACQKFRKSFSALVAFAEALFPVCSCSQRPGRPVMQFEGGSMYEDNGVKVLCLHGDWESMGRQWGALGRGSMCKVLDFIVAGTGRDSSRMDEFERLADDVFSHYPEHLRRFVEAASETSGLSVSQLKVVNALEWGESMFQCSGIACWGAYSDGPLVYGRNYDALSYGALGNEVVVTVFHPADGVQSFATVGYAGELYCVNGFNESGLFIELNNGMASSGHDIDFGKSLNTTELMRLLSDARTLDDADRFFAGTPGASGFLVGVSDGRSARCYEWYGDEMHRSDTLTPEGLMVMNNHFTSPEWDFSDPAEEDCWQSHARRANLIGFAEANKGRIDADAMMAFMRRPVADGGPALIGYERYQIVAVPARKMFYLNIPDAGIPWAEIDLKKYF